MRAITVEKREEGQRFDKYLKKYLSSAGSSFIYKMLRKKNITLNDKKASGSEIIAAGDVVKMFFSEETFAKFTEGTHKDNIMIPDIVLIRKSDGSSEVKAVRCGQYTVDILYEDDDRIFFDKPAGLLSQKAKKDDISLVDIFAGYMDAKRREDEGEALTGYSPGICNRLDRNTSGIVAAGKSVKGLRDLSEEIRTRKVGKYYRCIVEGCIKDPGHLKGYLIKDESSNKVKLSHTCDEGMPGAARIETIYKPISYNRDYSLIEVELITGKTHQIRAHLSSIGHPIIGDVKYGRPESGGRPDIYKMAGRQMLHACEMRFEDRSIIAPLPKDFERMLKICHLGIQED